VGKPVKKKADYIENNASQIYNIIYGVVVG
jgi:hypothetical protein